jgi:cytochrome o ubiquinol oxidase subunit III
MTNFEVNSHEEDQYTKNVFGFWIYILTDFILFAVLFATYAVLQSSTFGRIYTGDLFHLPSTLAQTIVLLISSFTIGIAGVFTHRKNKKKAIAFFLITFLLGICFVYIELTEFSYLLKTGNSWEKNAFLSAFFTLLGTYLIHMLFALLWMIVLIIPLFSSEVDFVSIRRFTCLKMFWQFLNIIWIFIFTFVYLLGAYKYD